MCKKWYLINVIRIDIKLSTIVVVISYFYILIRVATFRNFVGSVHEKLLLFLVPVFTELPEFYDLIVKKYVLMLGYSFFMY